MQLVFLILIVVSALLIVGGIVVLNLGRRDRRRRLAHRPDSRPNVTTSQHTISTVLTGHEAPASPQPAPAPIPSAQAIETALAMGSAIVSAAGVQTENEHRIQPQEALLLLQSAEALYTLSQAIAKLGNAKTDEKRATLLEEIKTCIQTVDTEAVRNNGMATFDSLYPSFAGWLLEQAPDLTEQDLRLCAFLALGQSSKDLAALTRRSVRTIETTTYHLRKKLGIPPDEKTADFLKRFLA